MNAVFICGTDTGIGKTLVTGLLAKSLLDQGFSVITQKWVQTGSKRPLDIEQHLKIMGVKKKDVKSIFGLMCPYIFRLPASPHLAAKVGARGQGPGASKKRCVEKKKIVQAFWRLSKRFDYVVVEGTGGAMVPLTDDLLQIDLVKELKIPVILVIGNKLGAINHALLTIEAIKKRGIQIYSVIFNNMFKEQNKKILKDNIRIITKLTKVKCLGVIPFQQALPLPTTPREE